MRTFTTVYFDRHDVVASAENHTALRIVDTLAVGNPGTTIVLPAEPEHRAAALDRLIETAQTVRRVALIQAGLNPDPLYAGGQEDADTAHTG